MSDSVYKDMSNFEISRWVALFEGVNIIAEKATDRGVNFEKISIKQPELERYIDNTCDNICRYLDEAKAEKKNKKKVGLKCQKNQ